MEQDIIANKSLGQHWLVDIPTLDEIVELADIKKTDVIVEIGPGTGNLTTRLVEHAKKVIAVELDNNLVKQLIKLKISNLEIYHKDILSFDFESLPKDYKIVANIPYYLTSRLIRVISESSNPPIQAILLVQKEIADRLTAIPPNMSILTLTAQYFWEVKNEIFVPSHYFDPAPKVDSSVVSLRRRKQLPLDNNQQERLFRIIKIAFRSKRKTLLNNLSSGLNMDKNVLSVKLQKLGIAPSLRAQNLDFKEWVKLLGL